MDTPCEGLDAFESEIGARPVLEVAKAYRRPRSALVPAAHPDDPPVLRVAMVGVPRWARRVRVVPAIAAALWTAAAISVGAAHVLTSGLLVTVIVESVPESPAKE